MAAVSASNSTYVQAAHPRRSAPGAVEDTVGPDPQLVAEMKHEINALVQEITQLAAQDISPDEFYSGFLTRIVSAMAAMGGAVWVNGENGSLKLQYQVNLAQCGVDASAKARSRHGLLLRSVADNGQAMLAPPS